MSNQVGKDINLTYDFPNLNPHTRLWELILHIARYSEGDPTFGKIKLAKILYYADFTSYREYGKPITGSAYKKLQFGPVPTHFFDILGEMETNGEIYIRKEKAFPTAIHDYERVLAVREASLEDFSGRDITIVNDLIKGFWNKSATDISNDSHGIAWESVDIKEQIPYELSILSDEELTKEEIARSWELIKEHGWDV
jgi:hypothetical protein